MDSSRVPSDQGFALPFGLVVLVALAFSLATLAIHVKLSQRTAAVYSIALADQIAFASVEQELVYRALLEYHGRQPSVGFLEEAEPEFYGPRIEAPFFTRGEVHAFQAVYGQRAPLFDDMPTMIMKLQDTEGMLDVNYKSEGYLTYLAELSGVSPSEAKRAGAVLNRALIENQRPLSAKRHQVFGLSHAHQICDLEIWNSSEICESRAELAFMFATRQSLMPNFRYVSDELKLEIAPQVDYGPRAGSELAWIRIQEQRGFYDHLSFSTGNGLEYIVALSREDSTKQKRFKLSLFHVNGYRPYSIREVVVEPRMRDLDLYERRNLSE
jgi:hypothetical protein